MSALLDEALALAELGIPVFPLRLTDKRPVVAGGFKAASTDPDAVARMFADPAAGLIGVPTGPASGFDVLDIDPKNGGLEWLHEHESRLPPTRRHHTRSGGLHLLFAHAPGLRNSASKIAPGVDIRAEGGYAVHWPAHGLAVSGSGWAAWPDWLLIDAMRRQHRATSAPAPQDLAPPSAAAVVALLNAIPNPADVTRDEYCAVNLAVQGCLRALEAMGGLDPNDAEDIRNAAAEWSAKWDSDRVADMDAELSRWESDWSLRTTDVSGFRHLLSLAARCGCDVSPWTLAAAVAEFGALPDEPDAPDIAAPATAPIPPAERIADPIILDHAAPLESAKHLVVHRFVRGDLRTLHRHGGQFWHWTGTHYAALSDADVRAAAYRFLDTAWQRTKAGHHEPFNPTRSAVSDVLDALSALVKQPDDMQLPTWLAAADPTATDAGEPADIIACRNGLLNIRTRKLLPHTAAFFSTVSSPFDYQPDAPAPAQWLQFLESLWPDDPQSIECLQEMFGLLLTPDARYHKIFLLIGPKRSGKGTIGHLLRALLGADHVASPTLGSLGHTFGLQPLIGKPLAIIADARFAGGPDSPTVTERLLSISAADAIDVHRKHITVWSGVLPTRLVVLTNELPRLTDNSSALASRFVIVRLVQSFYGREDHELLSKLSPELSGILNWSLVGLDRLRARGRFVQPESARHIAEVMEDVGSPVGVFIRDACTVGPDEFVPRDVLFGAWRTWCFEQNHKAVGTAQMFGRDLAAALPRFSTRRRQLPDGTRVREYLGIGLTKEYETGVKLTAGALKDFAS